ncbi:MAG: type II toxin-antitoxin system HicA family toxin [Gammaproteobacteria bacterium]|nr:type II toxin-antitoxin system HicA family toxin [Gammaproteobacteria bacterium]
MVGFEREVKRRLRKAGWHKERNPRGSHEIWANPQGDAVVSLPSKIKSRHTADSILKKAGLPKLIRR